MNSKTDEPLSPELSIFGRSKILLYLAILFVFILGMGVRLVNLTNPPLDFHAWRQLRSAAIARGYFYQMMPSADPVLREKAIEIGNSYDYMEPTVFEAIVAITYRIIGQEELWIARLYAILFWVIGGGGLFLLARKITSAEAALVTAAVYLLLPFGIYASRSFQPDPLMVMWIIWAVYCLYRWSETKSWKWAILAGVVSGIAVFIKIFAVFPVTAIAVGLTLYSWPIKKVFKQPQVWVTAGIMILIPGIYYLLIMGNKGSEYISGWVVAFSGLLTQAWFYKRWLDTLHYLIDLTLVLVAAASMLLLSGRKRILVLGMWIGYLLIGSSVPSLIITHSYYNLFAVPVTALSLAPLGQIFKERIAKQGLFWKSLFIALALVGMFFSVWNARVQLVIADYHNEVLGWIKMGKELPKDARIIGISQDYNNRLAYYGWTLIQYWPLTADQQMGVLSGGNMDMNDPYWDTYFQIHTANMDYFLITNMAELNTQPRLKANLEKFPFTQGEGYVLYDLRSNK
jgi:4-amino-4-deoxy-L-arabinose transferase-like glycosyltransferase